MSYIDNDPPKHYNIGELTNNDSISIYSIAKGKRRYKYVVALNLEEKRALILHGEKPFSDIRTNSKKEYLAALEIQRRAREYIELEKSKADDNSFGL